MAAVRLGIALLAFHSAAAASPSTSTALTDTQKIAACLAAAPQNGGVATIPPGDYLMDGTAPLPIPSGVTVRAYGARFLFPRVLGDGAQLVLFEGTNVSHFAWYGGEFIGYIFDPSRQLNTWEPNVSTLVFVINTSSNGVTQDILFDHVRSDGICGAVVTVQPTSTDLAGVTSFAQEIRVQNCTFLRSGRFLWDYGYLWQQIVWPEKYQPWEVARALKYFMPGMVRPATIVPFNDQVRCNNLNPSTIAVSSSDTPTYTVCFFGNSLPPQLTRGRQYYVIDSATNYIKISETFNGPPIAFTGTGSYQVNLMDNLQQTFYGMYQPIGSGSGHGAIDITTAQDVEVTNCNLSALGDLTRFEWDKGILFANNRIFGARMGAVWLTNHCQTATITGNVVDGADGSRVLTVDLSQDVTVSYNIFRDGGRGSWIVAPENILLLGNVFENNTIKDTPNWQRGRRSFITGGWETWPEVYFTQYSPGDSYGPVAVMNNAFTVGENCSPDAVTFDPDGRGVTMIGNRFTGRSAGYSVGKNCYPVDIEQNPGLGP
jgi:hypothetical protein